MEPREDAMNNSSSSSDIHSAVVKGRRTKRPRIIHPTISHEEEDLALCLILLAQGCTKSGEERENGKSSTCLYECKTCNKSFPTFQALGGHRSSHKKPKIDQTEEKREIEENFRLNNLFPNSDLNGKAIRVHECSICGLEFSSGQALGGHMRRHRPVAPPVTAAPPPPQIDQKEKSAGFCLDLNLPAPSDEERDHFRDFVFSASALVDCHY